MSVPFCLMRLGAPHEGHALLAERMLSDHPGRSAVLLVGSAEVSRRPDVPLPWQMRRDILLRMLTARGADAGRLLFEPLIEIPTDGHDHTWFVHVLAACARATAEPMGHYYFGDDYDEPTFGPLLAILPALTLHRVPRMAAKSGTELRRAVLTRDPALLAKYAFELGHYPPAAVERIARFSGAAVQ